MRTLGFFLLILGAVPIASAKIIYVDDDAIAGGDGSSWSTAHNYLQDALAVAESGDQVWVAEGTYKPDQGNGITAGDRTASFTLDGIILYGAFDGTEATNDPNGSNEKTILSGEIDNNSTLWSLHIVSINDSYNNAMKNFTISKGNANGSKLWGHSTGGGVYFNGVHGNENCIFENCIFENNSAGGAGGALEGSDATFINCKFTHNESSGDIYEIPGGGAVAVNKGTFLNCIFDNNRVQTFDGTGGPGGGVIVADGNFINCKFSNNSAGNGGGVSVVVGNFINCIFDRNTAKTLGGGIDMGRGISFLQNCIFINNSSESEGGAVNLMAEYEITFSNCTFVHNVAKSKGGAVSNSGSWFYDDTPLVKLKNCILWNNSSHSIKSHGFEPSFDPTKNTLQEKVIAQYPGDPNAKEAIYSYKYYRNIIQGWTENENAFSADPLFANIGDPVGPDGVWLTADDGLRLSSGSPAIDAGIDSDLSTDYADLDNDENTTELLPTDIAGYRRIRGSTVDLGAYEYGDELMPTAPQYSISAIASTGGTVIGGGTFEENTSVTLKATPSNSGYIFSGWSGDASGTTNPITISADSDKTITAYFSKDDGDDDGDGISNYEEIVTYGTSKSSNDTDGDGLTDKEETERGLNPNSSDKAIIDAVMELKDIKVDNVTPIVSGWYFVPDHGWFWTNKDAYPYTYSAREGGWLYFQSGNEKQRFYHYNTKTWKTRE